MAPSPAPDWFRRLQAGDGALSVYLMGIGGAGLAPLACILQEQGFQVAGSDIRATPSTRGLAARGIRVNAVQTPDYLSGLPPERRPQVILQSSAVPDSNPEGRWARAAGIPCVNRAAFLPALLAERRVVAVAGTHGKTTTTAMLVQLLLGAGLDVGYVVGASLADLPAGRAGTHELFVIEADEYDGMFLGLDPYGAVVTSLEWDHPDCFPTEQACAEAFGAFLARVAPRGFVIYNRDHDRLRAWAETQAGSARRMEAFGYAAGAGWILQSAPRGGQHGRAAFALTSAADADAYSFRLPVHGRYNHANAAAAWLAACALGVPPRAAAQGLQAFQPVARRFQLRGERRGALVYDDYAHHPSAVRAVLEAARERFPQARLWAVFQPHTFSRTAALLDAFADAFAPADRVLILPTFAARETARAGQDGQALWRVVRHAHAAYCDGREAAWNLLAPRLGRNDVVVVMGAGDCYKLSSRLVEARAGDGRPRTAAETAPCA